MSATLDSTLSDDRALSEQKLAEQRPFLFIVLQADQPISASSRHALGDIDEVHLRRGGARTATRVREGNLRQLILTIPDRWMSTQHAYIRRRGDAWWLEDAASRNGTWLEGKRVQSSPLFDASVVEVGHTFLVFRTMLVAADDERDVTESSLTPPAPSLMTLSPPLGRNFERLADVAKSALPVLLGGETGTGKELVARAVHELSQRAGAFVAVNCGGLPSTLVESELFGFRKGSFSGALQDRLGLVRSADGGTLFLDEIADLPAPAQAALLRVLQEREVLPIGSVTPVPVNLRILSATFRSLDDAVRKGAFRADLLARLKGFYLHLPPLRDRREDLGIIVRRILSKSGTAVDTVSFSADALRALVRHAWPSNIRELEHRLSLAVVLAKGGTVQVEHLFDPHAEPDERELQESGDGDNIGLSEEDVARREELIVLLRQHRGNVTAVARAMGKARMQIHRWIKRFGIDRRQLLR